MIDQKIEAMNIAIDSVSKEYERTLKVLANQTSGYKVAITKLNDEVKILKSSINEMIVKSRNHDIENARIGFAGVVAGLFIGVALTLLFLGN